VKDAGDVGGLGWTATSIDGVRVGGGGFLGKVVGGNDDTGDPGGGIGDLAVGRKERCKSAHENGGCVSGVDHDVSGGGGHDVRHCCFPSSPASSGDVVDSPSCGCKCSNRSVEMGGLTLLAEDRQQGSHNRWWDFTASLGDVDY
jgi:hypothetical protein